VAISTGVGRCGGYVAGMSTDVWDVVVVGGGPPGENAAQYAIQGSDRTAVIVEAERVGGECSYWACMPSKALLRPVEVLDAARAVPGVPVGERLDVEAVLARRNAFAHDLDDSSQVEWATTNRIDVVRGRGRLVGERRVEVSTGTGTRVLTARLAVVLATGSTARLPDVPGLPAALPWTSRDVTNLHEVPGRVAIVGGGVVACEAATWLAALGAEVTLLVAGRRLLERTEPFAGEMVVERLAHKGIRVRFGTRVERVERPDAGPAVTGHRHGGEVRLRIDGAESVVDEIVVATGRTPATADLGLETVGLQPGGMGFLPTDAHGEVAGVDGGWLYAVGDVTGRALLTHQGKYQARIAGAVIGARAMGLPLDGEEAWRFRNRVDGSDGAAVPQVVFTDPQVASVGRTEREARDAGLEVRVIDYDLGAVAGAALQRDGYSGRARLVVDERAGVLVGVTFVGPDVAELLHAATIAVVGRVPVTTLWHAVPAYPTVSEVWLRLLEAGFGSLTTRRQPVTTS
jgi:pyruvate/2-oxoglutarate dehydrogenase complex dihydrolipoamide dehydrogenase (E3) component